MILPQQQQRLQQLQLHRNMTIARPGNYEKTATPNTITSTRTLIKTSIKPIISKRSYRIPYHLPPPKIIQPNNLPTLNPFLDVIQTALNKGDLAVALRSMAQLDLKDIPPSLALQIFQLVAKSPNISEPILSILYSLLPRINEVNEDDQYISYSTLLKTSMQTRQPKEIANAWLTFRETGLSMGEHIITEFFIAIGRHPELIQLTGEDILALYKAVMELPEPPSYQFTRAALGALAEISPSLAATVLDDIKAMGQEPSTSVKVRMIQVYLDYNDLKGAEKLIKEMMENEIHPTTRLYNHVLEYLGNHRHLSELDTLFENLMNSNLRLDQGTITIYLGGRFLTPSSSKSKWKSKLKQTSQPHMNSETALPEFMSTLEEFLNSKRISPLPSSLSENHEPHSLSSIEVNSSTSSSSTETSSIHSTSIKSANDKSLSSDSDSLIEAANVLGRFESKFSFPPHPPLLLILLYITSHSKHPKAAEYAHHFFDTSFVKGIYPSTRIVNAYIDALEKVGDAAGAENVRQQYGRK